jgi:dTDP-glucose 4,6-dehydratase
MKNLLITGGAGFIGSNFIHYALNHDPHIKVVNYDALTYAACLKNLEDLPDPSRYTFIEGDICDADKVDAVLREHEIDTIVHFAAESHVDRSIFGPGTFVRTNITGTFTLLESARQVWLEDAGRSVEEVRFHHISTDEVYGSLKPDDPPFHETTPYAPNSPYAASKAASDHLVRAYSKTYDLPITLTNCSNNYGPYQFPEKLIPLILLNAIEGKPLPIYGDGAQIRDWLYVEDHCSAIFAVLTHGNIGEVYNIGGDNQPTNLELVRWICTILDDELPNSQYRPHESLITFVADRPGHDRRYAIDTRKIKTEMGWQPSETLDTGLRKTIDWYLSNPDWVGEIKTRPTFSEWLVQNYAARGDN